MSEQVRPVIDAIIDALSDLTTIPTHAIGLSDSLGGNLGVDSYQYIVFRERLESRFDLEVTDNDLMRVDTVEDFVNLIAAIQTRTGCSQASENVSNETVRQPVQASSGHLPVTESLPVVSGDLNFIPFEIGMPHTGINGLSESALLKVLGDIRWRQLANICGVPSKEIQDAEGNRLYAAFSYIKLSCPTNKNLSDYGENDAFVIVSRMRRYGRSIVDGEYYLVPSAQQEEYLGLSYREDVFDKKLFPSVRLTNTFVQQWEGAGWLKKSRPAHPGLDEIAEIKVESEKYMRGSEYAEGKKWEEALEATHKRLFNSPCRIEYPIVADRDLNGVGLVYFANFPQILDICEREALIQSTKNGITHDVLDRRATIERESFYFSNAESHDKLFVDVNVWIEGKNIDTDDGLGRVVVIYNMYRESDGRLMMSSRAEKILPYKK